MAMFIGGFFAGLFFGVCVVCVIAIQRSNDDRDE